MSNNEILELNKKQWYYNKLHHPIAGEITFSQHAIIRLIERNKLALSDLVNYFHNFKFYKSHKDKTQVYLYMKHFDISFAINVATGIAKTTLYRVNPNH